MKNLLEQLKMHGLSETQSTKAIEIVYKWVEENYPVMGTLAKNVLMENTKESA